MDSSKKINVRSSFPVLLSEEVVINGIGAIHYVRKGNKETGKIFLRQGNVYAVENPHVKFDLATRLNITGEVDGEIINSIKKSRQSLEKIVDNLQTKKLVPAPLLSNIIKEYFLGAMDEMFTWENVTVNWVPDVESNTVHIPPVGLAKLVDIMQAREEHIAKNVAHFNFASFKEFNAAKYYLAEEMPQNNDQEIAVRVILSADEKNRTLDQVHRETAISQFVLFHSFLALENNGLLSFEPAPLPTPEPELPALITPPTPEKNITRPVTPQQEKQPLPESTDRSEIPPALPFPKKTANSTVKGPPAMTYSSSTNRFDVSSLLKQLHDALHLLQDEIATHDKNILDQSQEIATLQASLTGLQLRVESEKAARDELANRHKEAVEEIKGFTFND